MTTLPHIHLTAQEVICISSMAHVTMAMSSVVIVSPQTSAPLLAEVLWNVCQPFMLHELICKLVPARLMCMSIALFTA